MRSSQLHRNKPLEDYSVAYVPTGFIADIISPKRVVTNESDTFYVYAKDTMSIPETIRADGAESNQATFNVTTASYQLVEHALHDDVTDRQKRNADKAISPELDVTADLTRKIMLRRENDLMTLLTNPLGWSNALSLTATLAWSANTTLSNPIIQVDSLASAILQQSGKLPNVLALADASFRAAKEHISIVDRIKYTSQGSVTEALLSTLFNVEKLAVSRAIRNTGDEGLTETTTAQAFLMTDTAWLGYVETPGLRSVQALVTFWQKEQIVKKWREEKLGADRIEVSVMYQHRAVCSDAGAIIVNTNQ